MSDSSQPHGLQPTRLLHPWDFPGKSTGVGCHRLLPHGLYSPWNSPGQNTGVGSLSLLQQIFPTQKLNQGLLHCRWILYQLSYQGSDYLPLRPCLIFSQNLSFLYIPTVSNIILHQNLVENLAVSSLLCVHLFSTYHLQEKAMATHSSTLAWRIPWMEEPGGLQSMGLRRVRHD